MVLLLAALLVVLLMLLVAHSVLLHPLKQRLGPPAELVWPLVHLTVLRCRMQAIAP